MRILHTSDWHIGRTLHGVDLLQHHAEFFDHLVELARTEAVDAVLVSGDVYDRAIPPIDAVELLSSVLSRLSEFTHVILTPGNHDSAIRLGFAAALMKPTVHIRSRVSEVSQPVELRTDQGEEALIYALPYLDPDASRQELALLLGQENLGSAQDVVRDEHSLDQEQAQAHAQALDHALDHALDEAHPLARSHEAVMSAAMTLVRADIARRTAHAQVKPVTAVMAHAFVVGGQASESERDIRIGGVDSVPSAVFDGVDYVALGHLHGPQVVKGAGSAQARYSGSPLAFSFSEMNHKKSSVIVELGPQGVIGEPRLIPAPVPRRLAEVTGTMDELMGSAGDAFVDAWLRVIITDSARPQEMNARLKARFPHALVLQHRPQGLDDRTRQSLEVTAASNPAVVAAQFIEDVTGAPATDSEKRVLESALDRARAQERSA